jgi:hypothetical protein
MFSFAVVQNNPQFVFGFVFPLSFRVVGVPSFSCLLIGCLLVSSEVSIALLSGHLSILFRLA